MPTRIVIFVICVSDQNRAWSRLVSHSFAAGLYSQTGRACLLTCGLSFRRPRNASKTGTMTVVSWTRKPALLAEVSCKPHT